MRKLYVKEVERYAQQFVECKDLHDLQKLNFDTTKFQLLSFNPPYYSFKIRKSSGKFRPIEAPEEHLKIVQRQFNFYLQCVYFMIQTKPSFGYIIRVKDQNPWKNILTNAKAHLGAKYMLNVDFKDFFHQFTEAKIFQIFESSLFDFDKKTSRILTKLFTYKGRLPMGTPTSPVLSNIGTINFDNELLKWADKKNISFTRFVDDMTFSSKLTPITKDHLNQIKQICHKHHFKLNPNKTTFFGENDVKKVTKLVLNETVDIDKVFYKGLNRDLQRLQNLVEVNFIMENNNNDLLKTFKKEVEGQINFIGMIEGYDSQIFYNYRQRMKNALTPKSNVLSSRWTNFNYF